MAVGAIPILPVQSVSGNAFNADRIEEEAAQSFLLGTPVSIAADGGLQAWNGTTFTANTKGSVVGVSYEAASNLASLGKGAPAVFGAIGQGAALTFGSVPNQASAVNIPHGAPINDGRCGFVLAGPDIVFSAVLGNAGSPVTPAIGTDRGVAYTLSKDANNFWYVNRTVSTANVVVVGLDPRDVPAAGTRVLFQFLTTTLDILAF